MTRRGVRVGVLGGTFDPIHAGHVDIASAAGRSLDLTEVRFVTNRRAPHKPAAEASTHHRHAMVALATMSDEAFLADPREMDREGVSYTIDTLESLRGELPEADLFFLVGGDSLRDLHSWHRWRDIMDLATIVAVSRAGLDADQLRATRAGELAAGHVRLLEHEPPPWSSTLLRQAMRRGLPPPMGALPPGVADYIRKSRLYARAPAPADDARSPT